MTRCGECGEMAEEVSGRAIHPHRPDLASLKFWRCPRDGCDSHCGSLSDGSPVGVPAGPATRKARGDAHAAFDPIWRSGRKSRSGAYRWLARRLELAEGECHIGRMDEATARRVVEVCQERQSHLVHVRPVQQEELLTGTCSALARWRRQRQSPWGRVDVGDLLYLAWGGQVTAEARVTEVRQYAFDPRWVDGHLASLPEFRERYRPQLGGSDAYWGTRDRFRGAVLVGVSDVRTTPPHPAPAPNSLGWVVGWRPEEW